MEEIKVSVIVPVYNTKEKYLRECLNSLVNQTIKDYIEIIIVDDGSKEECAKICDEYCEKYLNFSVIHQENQGVGKSRNNGMRIAKGKWIMFVDSDDWVEKEICEKLLEEDKEDIDIIIASLKECYKNKSIPIKLFDGKKTMWKNNKEELQIKLISKELLKKDNCYAMNFISYWGKLYRKSFLEINKLNTVSKLCFFEDRIFNLYCYEHARKVVYKNLCLYNYRKRKNSLSNRCGEKNVEQYMRHLEEERKFIVKHNKSLIFYKAHEIRTAKSVIQMLNNRLFVPSTNYTYAKNTIKEIISKKDFYDAICNLEFQYFSKHEQICIILLRKKWYLVLKIIVMARYYLKMIKFKIEYYS